MQIELKDGAFCIDAALLGKLLDLTPQDVPQLMKQRAITSLCERGIDVNEGEYRLSFFYRRRQLRLTVDAAGCVLHHKIIEMGERRLRPVKLKSGGK